MNNHNLYGTEYAEFSDEKAQDRKVLREAIDDYIVNVRHQFNDMPANVARDTLLSEYNYQVRSQLKSCRKFGLTISPGDCCYIDFGRAYLTEIGYQHFGLVINVFNSKAFVIPMTSNFHAYETAYDEKDNPEGVKHLMRLGKIEGLSRCSVLFLNDGKFINTARIIDIKAHLDPGSELFEKIYQRFLKTLDYRNK